jgi:hypothetical protein
MTFITQVMPEDFTDFVFVDRNCREGDIRRRLVMQFETHTPDVFVKKLV